jgi:signal peptidase I
MTPFESTIVDVLGRGVAARFHATGDSMHPTIRSGEHVHVAPAHPRSLRVGDVVLTRATRGLTVHRIIRVTPHLITTRGDNALVPEAAVPHHNVLGRVTHVEREGATVTVPTAPLRIRVVARNLQRNLLLSLSQIVRSLV